MYVVSLALFFLQIYLMRIAAIITSSAKKTRIKMVDADAQFIKGKYIIEAVT